MRNKLLIATALLLSTALGGCEYLRAVSFDGAEKETGISEGQEAKLVYINKGDYIGKVLERVSSIGVSQSIQEWDPELLAAIQTCSSEFNTKSLTAAIPFIAVGAELAFGFAVDELASRVIELRKKGTKTYTQNVAINGAVLDATNWSDDNRIPGECLLFTRSTKSYSKDENGAKIESLDLTMAMVVQVIKRGNGAVYRTSYLRLDNAVALTSEPDKGNYPIISVSSAVSSKGLRQNSKTQAVQKVLISAESLGTANVEVGSKKSVFANCGYERSDKKDLRDCGPESDIVAPSDGTISGSSYTIAITEKGSIGFDADRVKAELDTIKAAIGPKIAEYVTTRLTPPEE